ncbi:MAG TPA: hypothetical protein VFE12_05080 [Acetobacteraceae bacterium]|jgi:hypothetical protein|nr:hypothetical protein [Acetobacteraceae bacterium]
MQRRVVLSGLVLSPVLAVIGCGTSQDQVKTDVSLIANGLSGVVSALQALPAGRIPPDVLSRAQAIIGDIRMNAAAISQAITANPDTVQAISSSVSTLSVLLTPFFPAAPAVGLAVQAALALLPVVLAAVGRTPAAATAAPKMTPEQARAVLTSAAAK